MKRYLFVFLLFGMIFLPLFSETKTNTNELKARLPASSGKERLEILAKLTRLYSRKEPKKALTYGREAFELLKQFPDQKLQVDLSNTLSATTRSLGNHKAAKAYVNQSIKIAEKIGYKKGYALALLQTGWINFNESLYEQALGNLSQARELFKELDHQPGLAKILRTSGIIYYKLGDYSRALKYFFDSCRIYEKSGKQKELIGIDIGYLYNNIALVYSKMGNHDKAMTYFLKAKKIHEAFGNKIGIAFALSNIAGKYEIQGKYTEALNYHKQALKYQQERGFKTGIIIILINIAQLYEKMGNHGYALDYFGKALKISEKINDRKAISFSHISIGIIKRKMGQYHAALQQVNRGLTIAEKVNLKAEILKAYEELPEIFAALKNYPKTLYYYKKYKALNDSIFNETTSRKIALLHTRYEIEKKEKEIALLKKNKKIHELTLARQRNFNLLIAIGSGLILFMGIMIYSRFRLKVRMNQALNKEIVGHKHTIQKLQESEEKFRILTEASMVGIYIWQDNVIKYVNPQFLTLFGYTKRELVGESPLKLVIEEDRPLVMEKMNRQSADTMDTPTVHYEFRGITKNGEILHLESYSGLTYYQGKPAILGTVIDITGKKKTAEKLLRSQKLEAVGILAGGIAHDFNNLMTVMVGSLEMVKDNIPKSTPAYHLVETIENAQNQATDLSQKFIAFSRGGFTIPQKVILNAILKETIDSYPKMKSFIADISIPPDLKPIYGNQRQLKQVFINLLRNAEEAKTHEGESRITIAAENIGLHAANHFSLDEGNYIRVFFKDNGSGIPSHQLEKVFEPFFSTKHTALQKGMGLGLAICHTIIKRHKGHISITSEIEKGTTVELLLPAYPS